VTTSRHPIDGLLLDMDGVLTVSWKPLPGAVDALREIRSRGVPFRIVTNTTSHSRATLAGELRSAGFDVSEHEVLTAPAATAAYLRAHHPGAACFLLGEGRVAEDMDGVRFVDEDPDVVVVGGADEAFTFDSMNRAFRMLLNGAAFVAMHRNLSWMTDEGLCLDAGAYVAGLELATGATAVIAGKPSADFFRAGLEGLDIPADRAAMVGDDLNSDVLAAQTLGMTGILVRTGKFRQDDLSATGAEPDAIVDSIADVPGMIGPPDEPATPS
jgi:HAD superfamily hydrolase (TIGR01458 family)